MNTQIRNTVLRELHSKIVDSKARTLLYSSALTIWVLSHMLQESLFADNSIFAIRLMRIASIILLLCIEIGRFKNNTREDFILAILLLPFAISGGLSHNTVLFQGLLFCFSARKDIDIDKCLKFIFVATAISLLIIIVLSQIGLVNDTLLTAGNGGAVRTRSSLGFAWPSRAPNYFLTIVLLLILMTRDMKLRIRVALSLLLCIIDVLLFVVTDSRAPCLLAIVAILGLIFVRASPHSTSVSFARRVSSSFLLCMGCLIALTVLYRPESDFLVCLNAFLSGRLHYSNIGIQNNPLTLFGSSQVNIGNPSVEGYFDSGYLRSLYQWGIVPTLIFIVGTSVTLFQAMRRSDFSLAFVLVLLAVHSTVEGQLVLLYYSPFLIYMGSASFRLLQQITRKIIPIDSLEQTSLGERNDNARR